MNFKHLFLLSAAAVTPGALAADPQVDVKTSAGTIRLELYPAKAPKTVENFLQYVRDGHYNGTIFHRVIPNFMIQGGGMTPNMAQKPTRSPIPIESKNRLYDGTIFHRVIPNFMIQGGDPAGTGFGGPGYRFEDETKGSPHKFDKSGKLAMANAGPNTNGSQFFITVAPTPWLTGNHTIFGEVVEGYDVVEKIAAVPRNRQDKPNQDVKVNAVKIEKA